jgi:RNA polymerase sigma-70 factor (ECF subfamily)
MNDDSAKTREENWRTMMRAAQDGDSAAYARLLAELLPELRRVVRYRWRTHQDADDIVQDILLSVHSVRHTYDPARPFMPWLMTIAARRIADAARRNAARGVNETTVDIMPETFDGADTKNEQDRSDDQEAIRRAMADLPAGQRQAIELLKVQGLSLQEASAVAGKSVTALKVTVHRAVKAMRETLNRKT